MPKPEKEVWFLTGSQSLYGDQTLKEVAEQSDRVSAELAKVLSSDVRLIPAYF